MVDGVGQSAAVNFADAGASGANLEAQLAAYQKRLAECVNCESAKTAEGKTEIREISDRISVLKQRIDGVAEVKSRRNADSHGTGVPANGGHDDNAAGNASPSKSIYATVGSIVDVRA